MFRLDSTADTYRSAGVSEVYPKLPHGPNDCHQTLNGVAVDHGLVLETLLRAVASLVDYLHLLHDRRLAALASAWKYGQNLYLNLSKGQLKSMGGYAMRPNRVKPETY